MTKRNRAAVALATALALMLAISAVAFAASCPSGSNQSGIGAGVTPSAQASSVSNDAWIYTSKFQTSTPKLTEGSVQLKAIKGAKLSNDRADVTARFRWDNANYVVHVVCMYPISGQDFPGHGPVQFMRPVLGSTDLGTLGLPETHAHVAVYGRSSISRNGKLLVDNQPTVVLVTKAIHNSDQQLQSSPNEDRNEIQLIVPGPLDGQKFVKPFPNGYFYIYWPDVKLTMSSKMKPTPMMSTSPSKIGRGPALPKVGTQTARGSINISLTNTGIKKSVGRMPSGLYKVTVTNNSSRRRGLVMSGADLCCTFYTRFSKLIPVGGTQTFRWYFAPGKTQIRDFLSGYKTRTSYTDVKYGKHSSSIVFE